MSEWISVKKRLPDDSYDVLVYVEGLRMAVSCYFTLNGEDYHWENRDDQIGIGDVTHWMPLPKPPEENEV